MKKLGLLVIFLNIWSLSGMGNKDYEMTMVPFSSTMERSTYNLTAPKNNNPKQPLNKKKLCRNGAEATLHIVNIGCGIAGMYLGTKDLINQAHQETSDAGEITADIMGGLISGFGSAASGTLGLVRMGEKIILVQRHKNNLQDRNLDNTKQPLNKKKLSAEATLHIINVGCGIAGMYWGIKDLINQAHQETPDAGEIAADVMGGLVSGFGSAASGVLGLVRMGKKIILTYRHKHNPQDNNNNNI